MTHRPPSRLVAVSTAVVVMMTAGGCSSRTTDDRTRASDDRTRASGTSSTGPTTASASAGTAVTTSHPRPAEGVDGALVSVDPTVTGEGISGDFGEHAVAGPAGRARGELLVFFPGTGAEPDAYSTFLERAAGLGYHVIGLAYPNDVSVNFDVCRGGTDPDCARAAREEVLWGTDASGLDLDVSPADAAIPRLVAVLAHLSRTQPGAGWDRYLRPDRVPSWSDIAVAGHSQGGGHAAFVARTEAVARVILFDATEPAPWTTDPMVTPGTRMWGLAHAAEPFVALMQRSWENLGLPGEPVQIDDGALPWNGSHRLVTATDACRGDPASRGFHHNCPVADEFLPDPLPGSLSAAWELMLTG